MKLPRKGPARAPLERERDATPSKVKLPMGGEVEPPPPPTKRGPLGLPGWALLLDRRRRIIRPHRILPLVAEGLRAFVWMFDACYSATTHDEWLDGIDRLLRAGDVLRDQKPFEPTPPDEDAHQFAPAELDEGRRSWFRKPMALVRSTLPGWRRRR